MRKLRADKSGPHRLEFERNKKRLLFSENTCGICGRPVDKSLKYPDPMSPVVDHIVPIAKGGHPSDIENLQLAHWCCNRRKADKLYKEAPEPRTVGNQNLPQSRDWSSFGNN